MTLHVDDAVLSGLEAILNSMSELANKPVEHQRRLSTIGTRSVLVVHVSANDVTTSAPEGDLVGLDRVSDA